MLARKVARDRPRDGERCMVLFWNAEQVVANGPRKKEWDLDESAPSVNWNENSVSVGVGRRER